METINNDFVLAQVNNYFSDASQGRQIILDDSGSAVRLVTPPHGDAYFMVIRENLLPVAKFLKESEDLWFNFLKLVTAAERKEVYSSVYHLYSYKHEFGITLRVDLPKDNPVVDSVCRFWESANWLERECYDMLGIIYKGHPELRRILLPLDWEGYPLRKDYVAPSTYGGIDNA